MDKKFTYNYLEEYIRKIRSNGRYAFTLDELKQQFSIEEKALLQAIFRLKKKKMMAQVRKGFYVFIPPEYSNWGILPPNLFETNL
jgi:predicted transcriptional regulator of viral defense system